MRSVVAAALVLAAALLVAARPASSQTEPDVLCTSFEIPILGRIDSRVASQDLEARTSAHLAEVERWLEQNAVGRVPVYRTTFGLGVGTLQREAICVR